MADIALDNCLSKGHEDESWAKTLPQSGLSSKTSVNGKKVVLTGKTLYALHTRGNSTHTAQMRIVTGGSSKASIEGHHIARKGDALDDGDIINEGYSKVFIGG